MAMESTSFAYMTEIFPKFNDAKLKEGISAGPQILKLMKDYA